MAIIKEFQARFSDLVSEMDLNKKTEIAKAIGITYATFVKIYNYGILPSVPIVIRIADFFHVSIEYLLGNTDDERIDLTPVPATFRARLDLLRLKNNIPTVYDLSKRCHIHRNNIAQWLKKDYLPAMEDLSILANLFNVSVDYLVGRCEDENIFYNQDFLPRRFHA